MYKDYAIKELKVWRKRMARRPSIVDKFSKRMQVKVNNLIPEKVHATLTSIIKQMVRGVLFGATYTVPAKQEISSLEITESLVQKKIEFYKNTAAAEGGITGAGGILLGLADFPILLGIKIKLLFDIASQYGFDVRDYKERVFILHVFQLAFSSQQHRREVFAKMENWEERSKQLPEDVNAFDWRSFQQEYRDYIDLAKMAQLIPGIGAVIGFVVNYRLLKKLGTTAMNAYRMRLYPEIR